MEKEPEKIAALGDLYEKLEEILTNGPLYRPFFYTGEGLHSEERTIYAQVSIYSFVPSRIRMFCEYCQIIEWWETEMQPFHFSEVPGVVAYDCRGCGMERTHFWIKWSLINDITEFIKVGQWPPLTIEPPTQLAKALGKEDAVLYKKALINANFSHGIAALAYFRRVIENKVNVLLDLVAQAASTAEVHADDLKEIENIKAGRRVDEKIEYAAKILPPHLRPGGQNPLDRLYGIASVGLHGESDDECLKQFMEWRTAFEYLFENLSEQNERAQEYIRQMTKPLSQKGK